MKVLIFNTFENEGGASKATIRIHKALIKENIDSKVVVMFKKGKDPTIIGLDSNLIKKLLNKIRLQIDFLPLRLYRKRKNTVFTVSWLGANIKKLIRKVNPDLCFLTWISAGFIRIEDIALIKQPIIWRLSDSWPFTGGCHVPGDCTNYIIKCGNCHILRSNKENDLSRINWNRKRKAWSKLNMTIVCPSNWMADCARKSSLLADKKIVVIPNAIEVTLFKPQEKLIARRKFNFQQEKLLIMFGASNSNSDPNKGMHLLIPAIKNFSKTKMGSNAELIIFGADQPKDSPDFGIKVNYMGKILNEAILASLYAAVDIFIAPSLQDNSANTVLEALSCGTPCIAFNTSGMPDLIKHKENGYLAQSFDIFDLEQGIIWLLEDTDRLCNLGKKARESVILNNSSEIVAKKYVNLFNELTNLN